MMLQFGRILLCLIVVSTPSVVIAAGPTLRGQVIDRASGAGIPGAVVAVQAEGGATALTGADGSFALPDVPDGRFTLLVVAEGHRWVTMTVRAGTEVTVRLEPAPLDEETIVVESTAPETGEPVSYGLDVEEIRVMPGTGNDTLKSLQSLPGTGRVPFGLGGLLLRGTSPRATNVYLDGIEVPILYHFGGLASFYPSALLESVDMQPGGFGAAYGRGQGGIVTLEGRRGRGDRWRVASEASLIDASARAEGPGPGGGAWTIALRRSYVDAILALAVPDDSSLDLTLAPRYYDGQLRYDVDLGPNESLTAMIFGADDRMQFRVGDDTPMSEADGFDYTSSFVRAALRWQRRVGDTSLSVTPWTGFDRVDLEVAEQGITRSEVPIGVRADVEHVGELGAIAGGVDVSGGRFSAELGNEPPPGPGTMQTDEPMQRSSADWYGDLGLWTEGLIRVADGRLGVRPGLRLERFGLTDEWVLDPRLTVTHELPGRVTLRESFGLYHQPPALADFDPAFPDQDLTSSYAVQASVGAEVELPGGVEVGATGFSSELYDLPVDVVSGATQASGGGTPESGGAGAASRELLDEQFGTYSYRENVGRGRVHGVEILARREVGRFLGWISYTYSRSFRRGDPDQDPTYRPYVLDQPHVLTVLGSVALPDRWRVGARLRYATGNPFTPVAGRYYDADGQEYVPIDGPILGERLPAFGQLDLRVDRTWRPSWGRVSVYLDVQNVTNRVNPEGVTYNYDYTERDYTRGLPIYPSIGVEIVQ